MEYLTQEVTETTFSRELELDFSTCDLRRRMKLSAMLGAMASAGGYDYDARGLPYERMREMGQVFLLSQISLKVHHLPENRDILKVTTWENGSHGVHVYRCYRFTDRTGRPCIDGRSSWIIVNPDTRRVLRPASFTGKPLLKVEREIDCPPCDRMAVPEGMEDIGTHAVAFTELDGNGHLYSGRYGDIIYDALPEELQMRDLKEFSIHYSHEATLGQTLRLTGRREEDGYVMAGWNGEETCFVCRCGF